MPTSARQRLARRGRRGRPARGCRSRPRACGSSAAAGRSSAGAGSARSRRRRCCAPRARAIGGVPLTWWAVWDGERLHERTHRGAGAGADGAGARPRRGASTCASRRTPASRWSRRTARSTSGRASRAGSRCAGPCSGGPSRASASSTTRPATTRADTAWRWSAGVGIAESGARVAWNLVDGVHDGAGPPSARSGSTARRTTSTRCAFADDLSRGRRPALRGRRRARAPRAAARVRAPTTSSRSAASAARCPHAGALREGWGVMERHDVRW